MIIVDAVFVGTIHLNKEWAVEVAVIAEWLEGLVHLTG